MISDLPNDSAINNQYNHLTTYIIFVLRKNSETEAITLRSRRRVKVSQRPSAWIEKKTTKKSHTRRRIENAPKAL